MAKKKVASSKIEGRKLVFVDDPGGDWEGLYIDGKLVMEDHSLRLHRVLEVLGIEFESFEADGDWLYNSGNLPAKLEDVKRREDK